ncbi:hypothetical protein LTR64_003772 [Lithohypha guttulata]|uniref:uncharacterized protein n=1 Tax=Lithohypha guttulata TaxID=1690604 RepID=UPI002DE1E3E0|nr:hypothetical protein LTR51_000008 [Lithohypha guttulata]
MPRPKLSHNNGPTRTLRRIGIRFDLDERQISDLSKATLFHVHSQGQSLKEASDDTLRDLARRLLAKPDRVDWFPPASRPYWRSKLRKASTIDLIVKFLKVQRTYAQRGRKEAERSEEGLANASTEYDPFSEPVEWSSQAIALEDNSHSHCIKAAAGNEAEWLPIGCHLDNLTATRRDVQYESLITEDGPGALFERYRTDIVSNYGQNVLGFHPSSHGEYSMGDGVWAGNIEEASEIAALEPFDKYLEY